jgi:hypothetical protein
MEHTQANLESYQGKERTPQRRKKTFAVLDAMAPV